MGDLHHANKVRLYNALPFCGIEFLERSIRSEIPGIIDENVDQFAPHQAQSGSDFLTLGHIECDRACAGKLDRVYIPDPNIRPAACQQLRNRRRAKRPASALPLPCRAAQCDDRRLID
jgi:hypothetical protein